MTGSITEAPVELAQQIADRLVRVDGVRAVVLGGSWVRGAGDLNSDIDLGIYYGPAQPLNLDSLRALAAQLGNEPSAVTSTGEWGPWINGGAWLTVDGRRVDWLYRDLALVGHTIEECAAGRPKVYYQPGHPHGFHTHIYLAEAAVCQPLYDPYGDIARLKSLTVPYPPAMKESLIRQSLWEAGFALDTSRKSALREDVFHVAGGLFRCAACLVQVLYALNESYWLNEKGSIRAIDAFPLHPAEWENRVRRVLARPGDTAQALDASLAEFDALVQETRALCEGYMD
jgi:predicted nucleotidyltransferase